MHRRIFRGAVAGTVVAAGLTVAAANAARADGWGDHWRNDGGDGRDHGWDGGWGYPPPVVPYAPAPAYGAPYVYGPPPVVPYGAVPYGYRYGGEDD